MHAILDNATQAFNATMRIVDAWPPIVPLLIAAAGIGVAGVLAYRYASPQRRLKHVVRLARADLLGIGLFKDDPLVVIKMAGQLAVHTLGRLAYGLPPLLILFGPVALLLSLLATWYEFRPLGSGEAAVVELQLSDSAWAANHDVQLVAPAGVVVETPSVRDERSRIISWRIRATRPMSGELRWPLADLPIGKRLTAADPPDDFQPISVARAGQGWWEQLLHPQEASFDAASPVERATVHYPRRSTPLFGWDAPWWATVLIVSMATALALRPLLNATF